MSKKTNKLPHTTPPTTTVVDTSQKTANLLTDLKHCGVILQKHSIIKDLYSLSGPNAKSNEFQMHYWMLVFRYTFDDGGFFDIAIPTCYFNYEQFVSTAHVDFEMKDVSELSAKLEPIHNMITNQILATSFKSDIESLFGVQFEPLSVDVGTLHRHPGSSYSQRFSGTDLDANKTHHGIVFPLKSGIDKPSFSGILAIDSGECNVAHYEYRLVNGSYDTNDMTYTKGRCLAITNNDTFVPPALSSIQQFFGIKPATATIKIKEDNNIIPNNLITALDSLIPSLPNPNTQLVRSEHVKIKVHTATTLYGNSWNKPTTQPYQLDFTSYDYNLYVLRNSLERHYDFMKIPYKTHELWKLTKPEIEAALLAVYKLENDSTKTPAKSAPSGQFTICDITVHTEEGLTALTRADLIKHYDELDTYYYGKPSMSIADTDPAIIKSELIDQITELYINIYNEEQESINATNIYGVVTNTAHNECIDDNIFSNYNDY